MAATYVNRAKKPTEKELSFYITHMYIAIAEYVAKLEKNNSGVRISEMIKEYSEFPEKIS